VNFFWLTDAYFTNVVTLMPLLHYVLSWGEAVVCSGSCMDQWFLLSHRWVIIGSKT